MRIILLIAGAVCILACSSSGPLIRESHGDQRVSVEASEVLFDGESADLIGESVQKWLLSENIPYNADTNLRQILGGLQNRPDLSFRASEPANADIRLIIRKVKVTRRNFTLNIAKRGPILTVYAEIEIEQDAQKPQMHTFKSKRNMAEIVGSDKSFYKLTDEQISDPKIQKAVLDEAFDSLLGSAISTILGIRY